MALRLFDRNSAVIAFYLLGYSCAAQGGGGMKRTIEQSSKVGATVNQDLTVEHVRNRYKLGEPCGACGGLPGDWAFDPWENLPWIVTLSESGNWRFLIDRRDPVNCDMFSGFKIDGMGSIGDGISQTTGSGGRLNLHRSYFMEDLPA